MMVMMMMMTLTAAVTRTTSGEEDDDDDDYDDGLVGAAAVRWWCGPKGTAVATGHLDQVMSSNFTRVGRGMSAHLRFLLVVATPNKRECSGVSEQLGFPTKSALPRISSRLRSTRKRCFDFAREHELCREAKFTLHLDRLLQDTG